MPAVLSGDTGTVDAIITHLSTPQNHAHESHQAQQAISHPGPSPTVIATPHSPDTTHPDVMPHPPMSRDQRSRGTCLISASEPAFTPPAKRSRISNLVPELDQLDASGNSDLVPESARMVANNGDSSLVPKSAHMDEISSLVPESVPESVKVDDLVPESNGLANRADSEVPQFVPQLKFASLSDADVKKLDFDVELPVLSASKEEDVSDGWGLEVLSEVTEQNCNILHVCGRLDVNNASKGKGDVMANLIVA